MSVLILVADDEPNIRALLRDFLADKDCRVIEAGDGVSAFQLAESRAPDLVIMDMMMPGMSGATAVKMMGDYEVTAKIPVIVLSGADPDVVLDNLPSRAGLAYLKKPVNLIALWDKIRELLNERGVVA